MQLTSDSVITFHCPKCNAKLRIPTKLTGIEGPCPCCKTKITAPLSDQDDSSLDNNHPNEIIRKKVSPQKKHTTSSAGESLDDIFSKNRNTEVDLNPTPKPYLKNNNKTAVSLVEKRMFFMDLNININVNLLLTKLINFSLYK